MLENLKALDTSLFFFLNGQHNPVLDQVMWLATSTILWTPLYVWFLWLLFREHKDKFWLLIVSIILMITVSDQLCNLSKESIMRFRPSNDPSISNLVHIVKGYTGGTYGFYSSHASNSFAIAVFMILLVRTGRKYLAPAALTYAILTSYSRIYLGVHYPGDVLTGAIAGSIIAWVITKIYFTAYHLISRRDKSLQKDDS